MNSEHHHQLALQEVQAEIKKSASWFFWIAALSLVNSISLALQADFSFVIGLGITLVIGAVAQELVTNQDAPAFVSHIALALGVLVAGVFALFGIAGIKRSLSIYLIGMVLYALDGLIYLAFQDWLPVAFHVLALVFLWKGVSAIKEHRKLEAEAPPQNENSFTVSPT